MKRLLPLLLLLAACESETTFGKCVGVNERRNPQLEYKVSVLNVTVAIFFAEFLYPPIKVLVDETYCPVGPREAERSLPPKG